MKNKKFIPIILFFAITIVAGILTSTETDIARIKGSWYSDNDNGLIFYAPNEKDPYCGDAEILKYGESIHASYELHESSEQVIISYPDKWGDVVHITFNYEIINDAQLDLTPVAYSDSTRTTSNYGGETITYQKR